MSYVEARYLTTDLGRFISVDPIYLDADASAWLTDPQAQNAYAYARNNPVKYVDPDGEFGLPFVVLAVANYKPITRAGLSIVGSVGSKILNTPIANSLWQHSLQDNPGTWTNENCPAIEDVVKSSNEYQNLSETTQSLLRVGQVGAELPKLEFGSGDLGWGIHGTEAASFSAEQNIGGGYNVTTNISDNFDFDFESSPTFSSFVNNIGWAAQVTGVSNEFSVEIEINDSLE